MARIKSWLTPSNWGRVVPDIKDAFLRFPLPIICIVAASVVTLLSLHDIYIANRDEIPQLIFGLSYGTIALTSLKLFVESKGWSWRKQVPASAAVIAIVILFTVFIFSKGAFSASFYFGSALALSLLFSPYIKSKSNQDSVWFFNYQSGVAVFFAVLASLVLGLGLVIILTSLHYLFDIKIPSKIYGDIWILSWGILFPIYVLANLSRQFDFELESCGFPKGIRFITNYILLPLMVVYMAILYAYFVRIIVQGELPRGKLTWMIAAFGSVGIVTKLLAYPIRNSGTRLLAWFDRYYYYALIVPIILLGIAIGVRIYDYGVTEQRYTVVLMAVWFSIVALLAIFLRDRFHIKYVPVILAVLMLAGSFGPWGAIQVSIRSQAGRLEGLMKKYQLLKGGQVVPSKTTIPFADRKTMSTALDYLCENAERYQAIRPWFSSALERAAAKQKTKINIGSCYGGSSNLVKLMGFEYVGRWQHQEKKYIYRFYFNNHEDQLDSSLVNVNGYDLIGRGSYFSYQDKDYKKIFSLRRDGKLEKLKLFRSGDQVIVSTASGSKVTFDIAGLVRQLRHEHITKINTANSDRLAMTASSGDRRLKVHLILKTIQGTLQPGQTLKLDRMVYILMLKIE